MSQTHDHQRFTISEAAADWHEPMVSQRIMWPFTARQQWSLLNRFRTEQGTAVPAEGNGDLQTLICVLVARPRRCLTLSNPVR